ncbi:TetR family transcriptional regulator C-terminal domain-containing protein [Saccharibacillus sp. CPCC 101409]|uniref:TetR/AcrR family transcriptional regulator n=1 Tax=Saccharibacillus sp. CPCC 101409 TaxID=3058041 RepID=UPI002671FC49|nr:TetR/AcrR family transcriptional regulator [Saccharibacillus sp. CPCC 101409]MDO3409824.1 TetR family transcriptional regulator C-terminal domain-containing protein [Saccharibacillus sp. CPCC 101409]
MTKRHYDSGETRRVIAEKAAQLFARKGFTATSIADISRESGFSKGHIYYHFENKEKLFVHLAQETMRSWGEKWEAIASNYPTATEKMYAVARFVMHNYKTPLLHVGQELAANPQTDPQTLKQLGELAQTPMAVYADILRQGVDEGAFEIGDLQSATFLLGTWLGSLCPLIFTMEPAELERLFERGVEIFLGGIRRK